ncbi:PREDICTED: odorant receptor 13a-like [Wasmannia auropunctata]|uniref:odorant receptor 13a-like n=1 Tax=Wasmannia auropunctata TaxID=64793 RepID=UPI0005EE26CE|nr:PREDICTED: odorant receptor 13a-like [Wasmannia auropunctata]
MPFMGIWPEDRSLSQASSYLVIVPVLMMFCFCCGPILANLPFVLDDFDAVVENLSANITMLISMLKTIIFWSNGGPMKTLVSYMTRDWNVTTDEQDRRTMLGIADITRKLSIRSTMFAQSIVMIYMMFRLFEIRQNGRQLFYQSYFPYNATSSPSYELTLFGQFVGAMYSAVTYAAIDTFIATLVLHICGQLSNLRRELTNLCVHTRAEFQMKLGNIVRKHEYLSRFAETIEDCFNMMLLIQMLGCSLQLCFQCLQTFMSIMDEIVIDEVFFLKFCFLLIYVTYILLQLYLYCYIGEKLFVESTKIAYAAYDCSWYNLPASEVRSLMIIICRARLPLYISAGRFCSFNQELFGEV